ncbi:MAG: Plug domain-containing protein, partial [Pseudomonadota bacterium]
MPGLTRIAPWLLCSLLLSLSPPGYAQSDENVPTARQVYTPDEFARFAPRSALDMVRQVPGFVLREGGGERGFGQADTNVLINGRRISGKSNGPVEALGRITASSVKELIVLDGASLDLGGLSGQVLNVVTSAQTSVSGRFTYRLAHRSEQDRWQTREFDTSLAGSSANANWTLRLANEQGLFAESGLEQVFDGEGNLTDLRPEQRTDTVDQPNLSGSYSRVNDNGSVLNLTGEVNGFIFELVETSDRLMSTPDANRRVLVETEDEYNFELGADYEFGLGAGRLKLIALHRFESSPTVADVRTAFESGTPDEGTIFTRQADEAESILRTEYTFSGFDGGWNWAVELTDNFLDIDSELERLDADGNPVEVPFPGANSRVEELRGETTVSYTTQFNPQLQLQSSVGAEYSRISQTGPSDVVRDFIRPKGFVSLNWKPR